MSSTTIGGTDIEVMDSSASISTTIDTIDTTRDLATPSNPKNHSSLRSRRDATSSFLEFEDSNADDDDSDSESNDSFLSTNSTFDTPAPQDPVEAFSPATSTSSTFEAFDNSTAPPEYCLSPPQATFTTQPDDTSSNSDSGSAVSRELNENSFPSAKPSVLLHQAKQPQPPITIHNHACLQCHLLGFRCSFSIPRNRGQRSCARCLRAGESFCIIQDLKRGGDDRERNEDEMFPLSYQYRSASGIMGFGWVKERAEALLDAEREKTRFAYPVAPPGTRMGLRRVFAREDYDDWKEDYEIPDLRD